MQITTIYLDLDGVCNRMIMHALEWHGCNVSRYDDRGYPSLGSYNISDAAAKLVPTKHWTQFAFWDAIPRDVWASTPPSAEFGYLIKQAERLVGRERVTFLTKPFNAASAAGKVQWIERFAPAWLHKQFLIGHRKASCAASDALLIDDSDAECGEFRKQGGQALLLPRPWNSEYRVDPLFRLGQFFEGYTRGQYVLPNAAALPSRPPGEPFESLRQCGLIRECVN